MKNKVILCGSMKVKDKIIEVKEILENKGFLVILPEECFKGEKKSVASYTHFNRIATNDAYILIVNAEKNNIKNYIGPNSLCEIAFGFYYKRKVYLLNDIYEPFKDELEGWGVIPLNGDLNRLGEI